MQLELEEKAGEVGKQNRVGRREGRMMAFVGERDEWLETLVHLVTSSTTVHHDSNGPSKRRLVLRSQWLNSGTVAGISPSR